MLKEKEISVLLLESNCERVCEAADSIYILRDGRVEGTFGREDYDRRKIERVILGDYKIPDTQKTLFSGKIIKNF